ncbi:hypothetical protein A2W54_03025 [Candidatus Giovannonibacteria bacterium RIFCSPHIGHO2_02_43_13]|uniref:Uncharacterized protein n=1 Tax=Candidatus Giovannonibacteria bacterium RIFCSPHIGHO2_02_43_13 TaxID=1798330 RepID=A0A1F5WSW2_9BACT|nr:MAG: hypothetical protein UW28_C0027G0004 [Parcubacteria group bacterium GW2011_GWA2_44_13]OGF74746.1 MAG: hypothetical protein A3E06_01835 [Candidatus Giovannonibacteria bacterium RIFCSPHIGHO2_12_FULL_44_42]OGF78739.1 MAG: hypothetical protein A2W54_03025 [Candidatus Giovannonibacteria bacterium RIFCSPHIGHO2_02_43_13]OGF97170.1 MAG: hypothetical protein A3H08_00260 [Candidatus Giovannonibacteria bacterium RIFCSPLOWO2_12_FULL_44_32]
MKTYLKCVYANKFTLTGYLMIPCFYFAITYLPYHKMFIENESTNESTLFLLLILIALSVSFNIGCLVVTCFGADTLKAYRRTMSHFKDWGAIDERFENQYAHYCGKCGVRLAKKEIAKLQKPH